jgi:hypothetical protein
VLGTDFIVINWVFGWISIDYLIEKGVIKNDKQTEKAN